MTTPNPLDLPGRVEALERCPNCSHEKHDGAICFEWIKRAHVEDVYSARACGCLAAFAGLIAAKPQPAPQSPGTCAGCRKGFHFDCAEPCSCTCEPVSGAPSGEPTREATPTERAKLLLAYVYPTALRNVTLELERLDAALREANQRAEEMRKSAVMWRKASHAANERAEAALADRSRYIEAANANLTTSEAHRVRADLLKGLLLEATVWFPDDVSATARDLRRRVFEATGTVDRLARERSKEPGK